MTWERDPCSWESSNGHKCSLKKDHLPLKAWPYHAVTPCPHLGSLQDVKHGGLPLNPSEDEDIEGTSER